MAQKTSPNNLKRRFVGLIKLLWLGLVAVGLWWFVQTYDLRALLENQTWGKSLLAIALVIIAHAGVILTQGEAIRANGPAATLRANARIFNLTNMSKYIPVSGANLLVNGVMIRNLGHSPKRAASALLLLTYWSILGASIFGAAAAGSIIGIPPLWGALLGAVGGTIALWIRPERYFGITGSYSLFKVILGQILIWLGYGFAFAIILNAGSETLGQMALYGSAYDLSFGAGMLAIFAPSGVGVREAVTALVIESRPVADIIAATIYLRVLILAADIIVFLVFWIWGQVDRKTL
ncbi:MAG: hypothetical protein AAFP97_04530 [Pseudomonadota bacterium]